MSKISEAIERPATAVAPGPAAARGTAHRIGVTPMSSRPGWTEASCSCGQSVRSRVQGVIDQWIRWHKPTATR